MLKKHIILSWLLAFGLSLAIAAPALAAEKDDFMPSEIINAISDESNTANHDILAQISLSVSLEIDDVINIDTSKIHQTYPMVAGQKQQLIKRGYSNEEIAQMDIGDYFNIESTWVIAPHLVPSISHL